MANGLIGGFGSFGQTEGQTQGNLLGGVFQQQPTRGELRRGLLSELVQQYGGNAQQTGGAAIGAGLGIGISKLLGRDVQGAERADKIRRVQERVNSQFGEQFASDPYSAFTGTAQALFDEGLIPEANAALQQAANYRPEPVETERVVSGDSEIGQQLGLGQGETAIASFTDGVPTGIKDRQMPDEGGVNVGAATRFVNTDSGETLSLVRTDQGFARQSVDAQGNAVFTPVDMSNLEPVSARETGGAGSFGGGGDFSDLGELRNVTVDFAEQANQLKSELRSGLVGVPATLARGYSSASSQVQSVLEETLGITRSAPNVVEAYSETFDDLGLANASAEIQSALLNAGITNAYLQQGGSGDVRKNEVERSLRQLRIGSGDPEQIASALGRTAEDAIRRFNISRGTAQQAAGEGEEVPFEELRIEDFGLGQAAAEQSGALTVERVESLSMSDLQSLDPNQIPNDPRILQAIDNRLNELENQMGSRVRGGGAR